MEEWVFKNRQSNGQERAFVFPPVCVGGAEEAKD